jgi:hypothetical protein
MESMMSLSSYVGHGEKLQSMSPEEARAAEIQAQALLAHLRDKPKSVLEKGERL